MLYLRGGEGRGGVGDSWAGGTVTPGHMHQEGASMHLKNSSLLVFEWLSPST